LESITLTLKGIVMKNNMNVALKQTTPIAIDNLIEAIFKLINELKNSHHNFLAECNSCLEIRHKRKAAEKLFVDALPMIGNLSERKQMEIELHFYRAIKKLNSISSQKKAQLRDDKNYVIYLFLCRELNKTIVALKGFQKRLSEKLYTDNTKELTNNPELYNELVEAWGDLAHED
jgi:hypothetical protein